MKYFFAKRIFPRRLPICSKAIDQVGSGSYDFLDGFNIFRFKDCTFWPHYSVAEKTNIISETVDCPDRSELLYPQLRKYPILSHKGFATALGDVWHNYYHRYVDAIPKLFCLTHPAISELRPTVFVTDYFRDEDLEIVRRFLPSGVSLRKVSAATRVRCDHYLHFPRLSVNPLKPKKNHSSIGYLPKEYLHHFRDVMGLKEEKPFRKLYVSRRRAGKRKVINEAKFISALEQRGFEVIEPEDYSVAQQMNMFNEAAIVVAHHGAALTNTLAMQPSSMLFEIFSGQKKEIHYSQSAKNIGLRYESIMGEFGKERNDDVSIDIPDFLRKLDAAHKG